MNLPIALRAMPRPPVPSPPATSTGRTLGVVFRPDARAVMAKRIEILRAFLNEHAAMQREALVNEKAAAAIFFAREELTQLLSDYFDISERLQGR
jgi:hypothetical protein